MSRWLRLPLVVVATSCGAVLEPHAPVAAPCTQDRIGTVTVVGTERATVAALAVLEGTLDDVARMDRVARTAAESLRWRGYARAEIAISRERACFTDLTVAVALGPRFEIAAIEFETGDDFPAAERLAVLEDELGRVNTIGGVHIDYRLKRALGDLERRYHDAGWLDAQIGRPRTRYDAEAGEVSIRIPIEPGNRYRIGAIRALGGNSAARRKVLEELGIEEGAWYDGPIIRRGIARARKRVARGVELRQRIEGDADIIQLEAVVQPRSEPVSP